MTLPDGVSLSVDAADDGISGPKPKAAKRRQRNQGRPGPNTQNVVNPWAAVRTGLAVTWVQHRGPGHVTFDPMLV